MSAQKLPLSRKWLFSSVIGFGTVLSVVMFHPELFKFSRNHLFTNNEALLNQSDNILQYGYSTANGITMRVKSQNWQQVGIRKNLYVFSAYYLEEEDIVQIIGIAYVKAKVGCTCIFDGTNSTTQTAVQGVMEVLPENHDRPSGAVFIRCPLKNVTKPFRIGIMVENKTTWLLVIYASPRRYNFTVCIPGLYGPFSDPLRIIEMVETDMIFGADYFLVYNFSTTPEVDHVLRYYIKQNKMEVIQWNLPQVDVWYWGQLASLQDCTYASRRQSKYLVLKDVDEFIVPHKHKNWHELMNELDKGNSKFASYLFQNTFFRLDWGKDNKGFKEAPAAEKFQFRNLMYVWREDYFFESKVRSKAIVHPERVVTSGIHFPWKVIERYSDYAVDTKIAYLHHYRTWWGAKTKVKDDFMRQFADELLANVNQTVSELGAGVKSWLVR